MFTILKNAIYHLKSNASNCLVVYKICRVNIKVNDPGWTPSPNKTQQITGMHATQTLYRSVIFLY